MQRICKKNKIRAFFTKENANSIESLVSKYLTLRF